LLGWSWSSIG